jgi:hypothetical protein
MPVPGTRNDENGTMMVAGRRGVLVIAAPPRRKVPPLVRGGGILRLLAPDFRSSAGTCHRFRVFVRILRAPCAHPTTTNHSNDTNGERGRKNVLIRVICVIRGLFRPSWVAGARPRWAFGLRSFTTRWRWMSWIWKWHVFYGFARRSRMPVRTRKTP